MYLKAGYLTQNLDNHLRLRRTVVLGTRPWGLKFKSKENLTHLIRLNENLPQSTLVF